MYPKADVWRTLKHEMETKGSVSLVTALYKTRVTKSKDLRDKVFSILGLLSEDDRSAIHVNYSPLYIHSTANLQTSGAILHWNERRNGFARARRNSEELLRPTELGPRLVY